MMKINANNERIKRKYLHWLEDAKRRDKKTTSLVAAAIGLFEASTGGKDFKAFHIEQARKFKRDQWEGQNSKTGKPLAQATIRSRLVMVKAFFQWLADQPGYKSRINHADTEYFNLTEKQERAARASRERPVPTIEQICRAIEGAPYETAIEKRDRALLAFTLLTGLRDAALASLPLGNVDLTRREVFQDARVVATKNSKTMTTFFFPVGEELVKIVVDWIGYLRKEMLFSESDPLFPKTKIEVGKAGCFVVTGLAREYWTNAAAIRRIFRERFEAVGLPYFHPHSFRKTLARLAYELNLGLRESKAWSQNLGHEKPMTTWTSYGHIEDYQTGEIMAGLINQ